MFTDLGLKTEQRQVCRFVPQNRERVRCGRMAVAEGTCCYRETCIEVKRSREGGVSVRRSDKKLNGFTPRGYLECVLNVRVFWSFAKCLYICGGLCGKPTSWASLIWRSSHLIVRVRLGFGRVREIWLFYLSFLSF